MCSDEEKAILERIIRQNGSCSGMELLCERCPLNKIKKREDGSYYSCWESIVPNPCDINATESMPYYRSAAEQKLSEIVVEEIFLEENDEDSNTRRDNGEKG